TITSTFPVHTESRDNVIALGKASFMTSTLINAVKRSHDRVAYYEEIEDEIKEYAKLMINEYLEYGLRGSDLTMAALGPVLKKISEYREIKSITGRFEVTDTLRLTSEILFQQILGEDILLSVDGATRGYLYSRISGQLVMTHDALQQVAKSLGISIDLLRDSTLFKEQKKGKQKSYSLRHYKLRKVQGNALIDQIHRGFLAYEKGGKSAFWKEIDSDVRLVNRVLGLISHGIERGSQLAPAIDPDTHVAQQLCET
ncbi:MAG: hypothetical protein ACXADH_03785, partial [Candidatus Kariarchaeaceae archaeon]